MMLVNGLLYGFNDEKVAFVLRGWGTETEPTRGNTNTQAGRWHISAALSRGECYFRWKSVRPVCSYQALKQQRLERSSQVTCWPRKRPNRQDFRRFFVPRATMKMPFLSDHTYQQFQIAQHPTPGQCHTCLA